MKRIDVEMLDYYDTEVVRMMVEKYGFSPMEALREFLSSETYRMLEDPEMAMWEFGPPGIFDIWECEKCAGDPRKSVYLRTA